ncbi:MAG: hypothetical protein KF782_30015 [Labilithrix sp.]|nr:hypothetical protein [Labilithrix sp.]
MHLPRVLSAIALAASALACSSVPDVQYVELDAATAATNEDDGGASGGTVPGTPYSCPDNPPPPGRGTCCGARLCLRCGAGQCGRCERADCDGDEVCCGRGQFGATVDCRRASTCM